jgi:HipA-like protein
MWVKNISVFDTDSSSIAKSIPQNISTFTLLFNSEAVGELNFDGTIWVFNYTRMFKIQSKLDPIPTFPDKNKSYESTELWPFFQARIPSLKQPKIQKILAERHIQENDIIALLRLFGVRSINNPFILQG